MGITYGLRDTVVQELLYNPGLWGKPLPERFSYESSLA